ncbi:WXG100-like domain-containing protein, partial [Nocardia niigatensis]|uniref:WXG100-like domain-containing protein n=1 Tax=Nocardia niigatensis TaxID=209249 RepID=UPI000593C146
MAIYLPSELEWLGWLVGMEWPEGNEDQMWGLANDWKTAADGLRSQVSGIDDAKYATLAAYVDGDGREGMAKMFDLLAGVGGKQEGNTSILDLAGYFDQLSESVYDTGTEIESTKLMFYSSLAMLAFEMAAAWVFPPTAPAVEAAAQAATRIAVRIIGEEAVEAIGRAVAKAMASAVVKFALRHIVLDAGLGVLQETGIEAYQIAAGHRSGFDAGKILVTGVSSGVGGMVGGKFGEMIGGRLAKTEINHFLQAGITGATSGLAGAGAGFLAGTATQFGLDAYQHGWGDAWKNMGNAFTNFDPRMLTAGVSNGGISGLNHAASHNFWEPRVSAWKAGVPSDFANVGAHPDSVGNSGDTGHIGGAGHPGGADDGGPRTHPAGFAGDSTASTTATRPTGDGSAARPEGGDHGGVATDSRSSERGTPTDEQSTGGDHGQSTGGDHGQTQQDGPHARGDTGDTHGAQPQAGTHETNGGSVETGVQAGKHETPAPTAEPGPNTSGPAAQTSGPATQGPSPAAASGGDSRSAAPAATSTPDSRGSAPASDSKA